MKKITCFYLCALLFLIGGNSALFAEKVVSLDAAIHSSAADIESALEQGTKIAVLNFNSTSKPFSDHVINEMISALVKGKKLVVVDRANIELIQKEMKFQLSGYVSDESAQSIGKMLGAQSIVSGSVEVLENQYRIHFRTIAVETAVLQAAPSYGVKKDKNTMALMGEKPKEKISRDQIKNPYLKNWLYLGGCLGFGNFKWGDLDKDKTNIAFLAAQANFVPLNIPLTNLFSLELGINVSAGWVSDFLERNKDHDPIFKFIIPIQTQLGGRIGPAGLLLDLGCTFSPLNAVYNLKAGFSVGGTVDFILGPGVIFFQGMAHPFAKLAEIENEPIPPELNSITIFCLGYKIGLAKKR